MPKTSEVLNLAITNRAGLLLNSDTAGNWTVYQTRTTDESLSMAERIAYANARHVESAIDWMIPVYINAGGGTGAEAYSYDNEPHKTFAGYMLTQYNTLTEFSNRGWKVYTNLGTTMADLYSDTAMKVVTLYPGFMDKTEDRENLLTQTEGQNKIALAILFGLQEWAGYPINDPSGSIDTTDPVINITTDDADTYDKTVLIEGTVVDDSELKYVKINGTDATILNANGSFNHTVDLSIGSNTFTITTEDNSSNTATKTFTIVRLEGDEVAPIISITSPANINNFITNEDSITITGYINEKNGVDTFTLNNINIYDELSGDNNNFSITRDLDEGLNTFIFKSVDDWDNEGSTTVTVTYRKPGDEDLDPPTFTVSTPALVNNQVTIGTSTVIISGFVQDMSAITEFTIDGETEMIQSDGSFTHTITGLLEGENLITIYAKDEFENFDSIKFTVIYQLGVQDTTNPVITITSPTLDQSNSTKTSETSITLSGTVSDASGIKEMSINGTPQTITNNQFTYAATLSAGTNTIEIKVWDNADNLTLLNVYISLETAGSIPVIKLDSTLYDGMKIKTSAIEITGTYSNLGGDSYLKINEQEFNLNGISSGTFSHVVTNLIIGDNEIVVKGGSSAQNEKVITFHVIRTEVTTGDDGGDGGCHYGGQNHSMLLMLLLGFGLVIRKRFLKS